jgi:hypothetical protein
MCSALLVTRLYILSRRRAKSLSSGSMRVYGGNPVKEALRIVVESALLYTLCTMAMTIASLSRSYAVYIFADMVSYRHLSLCRRRPAHVCMQSVQLISISFNLIIIRVCTGSTIDTEGMKLSQTQAGRTNMPVISPLRLRRPSLRFARTKDDLTATSATMTDLGKEFDIEFADGQADCAEEGQAGFKFDAASRSATDAGQ